MPVTRKTNVATNWQFLPHKKRKTPTHTNFFAESIEMYTKLVYIIFNQQHLEKFSYVAKLFFIKKMKVNNI